MGSDHPVNWLMFGTLGIVLLVLVIALLRFMRHRGNRHPMEGERERTGQEIQDEGQLPPR